MLPNTSKDPSVGTASATPDTTGVYDATNPTWVRFNAEIDAQLIAMEEQFRQYWTGRAVRESVGR
jgi:hypothetical protein